PEPAADRAVEAGDPDADVGQAQGEVGRDQRRPRIARLLAAEVHEALEAEAGLAQVGPQQVPDQARLEVIAACSARGTGSEDDARPRHQARLLEGQLALVA